MCYSKTIEFSRCRHKWPQYLQCDDVKNGQKCRKLRQGTEVYHQECPRCDPGYSARMNTAPIDGLKLSRSVQELQAAAAHAIEIERYQAYDSKTSADSSGELDKNGKRKSGNSFGSHDGGKKGKILEMFSKSLDRMGSLSKSPKPKSSGSGTALKHSKTTATSLHKRQRSDGNEKIKPSSPLAFDALSASPRKPKRVIYPDENGRFHAPSKSEAGLDRVVWADNVQSPPRGDSRQDSSGRSSGNISFDGPKSVNSGLWSTTGRPVPGHSLSVESGIAERRKLEEMLKRERPQPPEHSTSVDSGHYEFPLLENMWMKERDEMTYPEYSHELEMGMDESKILEEMWTKERAQMESPEPASPGSVPPDWPQRRHSREWSQRYSQEKVVNLDRLSSDRERLDQNPVDTLSTISELLVGEFQDLEEEIDSGTSRYPSTTYRSSADQPQRPKLTLQTCPPTRERRRLVETQEEAIRNAQAEARRDIVRISSQQASGEERRYIPHERHRSEDWDDLSPPPLRTSHRKKSSIDAVFEDPAILKPRHVNDWEKCGIDYLEEHCDSSSVTTRMKWIHLNGREDGQDSQKGPEIVKEIAQKPRFNGSNQEHGISSDIEDFRQDEKEVQGDPSSPLQAADVIDEVVLDEQVGLESAGVADRSVRARRGPTKGRGPLPKRKTSRERNAAEALQRADERLRSVRDVRGYIDFNVI